ncbi:MAG: clpC [Planctomycetaceae bacterium]|nr:clpC [Planctomycetaceae bacterium]
MYERFTDRARSVMRLANQEARRLGNHYIGTEHILLGLVKEGTGVAANVLKNLGVELDQIRNEVESLVQTGPADHDILMKLPSTPFGKKVIEYSMEEARSLNHNYVGTEHLLLGLARVNEGAAAQALMKLGLTLEEIRDEVLNLLGHSVSPSLMDELKSQLANKWADESDPQSKRIVPVDSGRKKRNLWNPFAVMNGTLKNLAKLLSDWWSSRRSNSRFKGLVVTPLEGIGPIKFGVSCQEVKNLLGKPELEIQPAPGGFTILSYASRGFYLHISPHNGVELIRCVLGTISANRMRDFPNLKNQNIGLGASNADLIEAYGEPDSQHSQNDTTTFYYDEICVEFSLFQDQLVSMTLTRP